MAGKQKLFWVVLLSVAISAGYFLLQYSIPDEININKGETQIPTLNLPLVEQQVISAGSQEPSNIPREQIKINCSLLGFIPVKEIQVNQVEKKTVFAGGEPVGIYMKTQGILVVGTGAVCGMDGLDYEPALNIIQSGDYITKINDQEVASKEELIAQINQAGTNQVLLHVIRNEKSITLRLYPVQTGKEEYKLGIWVRDDTQGIGTLTYVDEEQKFGALGHGISDVDTGGLLELSGGSLYGADILSVTKGERGAPGELSGVIRYRQEEKLGEIYTNTKQGIFGQVNDKMIHVIGHKEVEVCFKQEIKEGPATILSGVNGAVKEYQVMIEKIFLNSSESNKSMVIRVTDEELLRETGGIVQGMSGSPILQNGKLIGAVTHVFVQDSTCGYGIFIENMMNNRI